MKNMFINWKTTAGGTAAVLTAVADLLTQFATGEWDGSRLMLNFTTICTGLGLLFAKDGNVTGGSVRQ